VFYRSPPIMVSLLSLMIRVHWEKSCRDTVHLRHLEYGVCVCPSRPWCHGPWLREGFLGCSLYPCCFLLSPAPSQILFFGRKVMTGHLRFRTGLCLLDSCVGFAPYCLYGPMDIYFILVIIQSYFTGPVTQTAPALAIGSPFSCFRCPLCVCICVCMHICANMCTSMHVHTHILSVSMHKCHIRTYICTQVRMYTCVCGVRVPVPKCMCTCRGYVHVSLCCVHVYTCVC
jgi:hypothetical protein